MSYLHFTEEGHPQETLFELVNLQTTGWVLVGIQTKMCMHGWSSTRVCPGDISGLTLTISFPLKR